MSFIPLFYARQGWDGYGPFGTYVYNGYGYHVKYNDYSFGNGKPHVFVWQGFPAVKVDLVEVSDKGSYVDGINVDRGFEVRGSIHDGFLRTWYVGDGVSFEKKVLVTGDGAQVTYSADRDVRWTITLWRWYFNSVGAVSNRSLLSPVELPSSDDLAFSVKENGNEFEAKVKFLVTPQRIRLWKDTVGFNKISLDFLGKEASFLISSGSADSSIPIQLSSVGYPMISSVLAVSYGLGRVYGSKVQVRLNRQSVS